MINPFVVLRTDEADIAPASIEVSLREQYGQESEDLIVESLLTAWAMRTGTDLSQCRYIEIGANHPFATSSSYLLNRLHGMSGVLVEANEDLLEALRKARPQDAIAHCAVTTENVDEVDFFISNLSELSSLSRDFVETWQDGAVGIAEKRTVPARRVNNLLEEHFGATTPAFLSVDLEGLDLDILQDVDWKRWRPVVVQAEPSDHFVAKQSTAIASFMHAQGYVLVARTPVNLIFAERGALFSAPIAETSEGGGPPIPVPTAPFVVPRQNYSNMASVGIVTRTKNRTVLLRRALESVKFQTYPHWQLVIVNDGGDPEPVNDLIQAIFGDDVRVSVVHHPASVGMEAASNSGMSRLQTELAVIHDDDDSWAPDMLSVATSVLRRRNAEMPSIRGVVTRVNWVLETVTGNHIRIENVAPWNDTAPDRLREGLISLPRLSMHNLFPPIAFIFDLALARELGGFDEELPVLGDWDFHLRFCLKADIWVHPEILAFYHHRANAQGDMGNTVTNGKSKHGIYNAYLRNKMLRSAENPMAGAMILLRETGHPLQGIQDKLNHIHYDMYHNGSPNNVLKKKKKSKIGAYLSNLNRKRKQRRRS